MKNTDPVGVRFAKPGWHKIAEEAAVELGVHDEYLRIIYDPDVSRYEKKIRAAVLFGETAAVVFRLNRSELFDVYLMSRYGRLG